MPGPDHNNNRQSDWADKYHYREAPAINSCEVCSYAQEVDQDGQPGVEALVCAACGEDTGTHFRVDFSAICDLFMSDLMDDEEEEQEDEGGDARPEPRGGLDD